MGQIIAEVIADKLEEERRSGLSETRTLKSLRSTVTKYQQQIKYRKDQIAEATADLVEYRKTLAKINAEIEELLSSPREVIVTEHAILRYLERYEKLELAPVITKIRKLPPEKAIRKGNSIVTVEE